MNIVCLGDSITKGRVWVEGDRPRITRENYPALLARLLPGASVINAGVTGDTSEQLLARFDASVTPHEPEIVIIECGGNDCNFPWEKVAADPTAGHAPAVTERAFAANLAALIERVRAIGAAPLLTTLPPLDPSRYYAFLRQAYSDSIAAFICRAGGIYHWQERYSRMAVDVAKSAGAAIAQVRALFLGAGDYFGLLSHDGIHPSEAGYRVITRAVYQALPDVLPI